MEHGKIRGYARDHVRKNEAYFAKNTSCYAVKFIIDSE